MKALIASLLLVVAAPACAADLHVVRPDRIETFTGCTTTRLYLHDNVGSLTMFCPQPPSVRKNPLGVGAPGNSMQWDWYVSDATTVHAGEGCSLRAHFQNGYSTQVTELECPP